MSLSFNQLKIAIDIAIEAKQVPNIVGLQGIGKSDLVKEYCQEKGYLFSEITCSLIQEGDLSMPYLTPAKDGVNYAVNNIIQDLSNKSKDYKYVVLFLDEFNRASEQAQSELMNLVLQRRVVNFSLPDNARIVLAMNPNSSMEGYDSTNYAVSFSDSAIMGRVVNLNMKPVLEDWISYGSRLDSSGRRIVHPLISSFLTNNPSLFVTPEKDGHVNNSPRGWSRVSDLIYSYEDLNSNSLIVLNNLLKGTLEKTSASLFIEYYKKNKKSINYLDIALSLLQSYNDKDIKSLSEVEQADVFTFMCNYLASNDITDLMLQNYKKFIRVVSRELCYVFITKLQNSESYLGIYNTLLEDDDMCEYILGIMNKAQLKSQKGGSGFGKV